jgi:hypothetical protein
MSAAITRQILEQRGFKGFVSVRELVATRCAAVPQHPGVYVVVRVDQGTPRFRRRSVGGWYKNLDPTVAPAVLKARWVPETDVLYIGRSQPPLDGRVRDLVHYGTGCPVAHHGGRYLWQVQGSASFVVGWKTDHDPVSTELKLQQAFARAYGALPFANLKFG